MLREKFCIPTAPNITYCFAVVPVKDPIQLTEFRFKNASIRVDMFSPTNQYQQGRKLCLKQRFSKSVSKWRLSRNSSGFSRNITCLCYEITTVSVDSCAVIAEPSIYKEVKVQFLVESLN